MSLTSYPKSGKRIFILVTNLRTFFAQNSFVRDSQVFGLFALQIFLLPKVQVLPASHFPLYFHCPFDSQQMLVVSHCILTVHQNVFLILQFLPTILTFLLRKRLQLITCQKYIL